MPWLAVVIASSLGVGPTTTQSTTRPAVSRVIFVVDGTGSMLSCWKSVREDVEKRIALLKDGASFNVIVFYNGQVVAAWASPSSADEKHLRGAAEFLKGLLVCGTDDAPAALAAAVKQHPQEIWFYSDGDLASWPQLLDEAARLHRSGITINTVMVDGDRGFDYDQAMIVMARKGGGVCIDRNGKEIPESVAAKWPQEPRSKSPPPPPKRNPARPAESGVRLK